jgi:hypothetical protein
MVWDIGTYEIVDGDYYGAHLQARDEAAEKRRRVRPHR